MQVIVKYSVNLIKELTKILGYTPRYMTFKEKFHQFARALRKSEKNLATEEVFSLAYDSLLSDLRESIWVYIDEKKLPLLKDKIDILEVCK